jgi:class 3 adenylate cyclase
MDRINKTGRIVPNIEDPDRRIYLIQQIADEEGEITDDWAGIRVGDGTEAPSDDRRSEPRPVVRTFAFLDLCESTAYFEDMGPREALNIVSEFRSKVREVCAARGVRVAKWIGDGAMLVGVASGPVIATCVEVCDSMQGSRLLARGGVAVSVALPFDGDDYLGRGANFAARICDMAEEGEVLCDTDCEGSVPGWIRCVGRRTVEVKGMGVYEVLALKRKC